MNKITFLRNKKTGQIIRYNKYAAAEINMEPCDPPWGKEKQAVPDAMPGMPEPPAAIPLFTEDGQPVTLLSQVEADRITSYNVCYTKLLRWWPQSSCRFTSTIQQRRTIKQASRNMPTVVKARSYNFV